jgi:hypothetical protein
MFMSYVPSPQVLPVTRVNSKGQEVAEETVFVDHLTLLRFQELAAIEIKICLFLPGYWHVDKQFDDRTAVLGSPDRLWRTDLRTRWFNLVGRLVRASYLKVSFVVLLIVLPAYTMHSLKLLCLSVRLDSWNNFETCLTVWRINVKFNVRKFWESVLNHINVG